MSELSNWEDGAACKGLTDTFFGPVGERPQARERREEEARRICGQCVVAEACLEAAISRKEPYGFWGGQSEEDRHRNKLYHLPIMETRIRKQQKKDI